MIKIKMETLDHIPDIHNVNKMAFGKENEARLVEGIRQSKEFIPELSLIAVNEDERVIGHILFSKIYIETEMEVIETIALAPMAVIPNYQNKGIGSMLVNEGLKLCKEMAISNVIVLGHSNFYPKFGFVPASRYGIKPPFNVPDEVFMAIELIHGSLNDKSGTVKYPDAFNHV
jgi:putative acetyltransferase